MFETSGTIANLACSVLAYFGVQDVPGPTLPLADRLLARRPRNVAVLLLDGMGLENMRELLSPEGFFHTHLAGQYRSVYPPTTVAATASIDSGLFPARHGRLGWTVFYPELNKNVAVYTNRDDSNQPVAPFNAADRFTPYRPVDELIREAGGEAYKLTPYEKDGVTSLSDIGRRLAALAREEGGKYVYCYWPEPDSTMHRHGSASQRAKEVLLQAERTVEAFCAGLRDTLLLITADHGHTDADGRVLGDYPQLQDCLLRLPSIEPRTPNFFVKEGREKEFEQAFAAAFGPSFRLFTRREALEKGLFGPRPYHEHLAQMVGDYVAVALDGATLFNTREQMLAMPGVHAGGTERESVIPLVAVWR